MALFKKKNEKGEAAKSVFTVEVEKKNRDEKFNIESLKMWHKECFGGKISNDDFILTCQRCGTEKCIDLTDEIRINLVSVAVDGKEFTTILNSGEEDECKIVFVPKD